MDQKIDATDSANAGRERLAGKYLTFDLSRELYGVEILKVQEIIKVLPITRVPRTPAHIKGVINLRGKVIPVIDLRLKLGMPELEYNEKSCIIVVNVVLEQQTIAVGGVVDSVREVYDFKTAQVELPPHFGTAFDSAALLGIGKINEHVVMLLDISRVIEGEACLRRLAEGGAESGEAQAPA